MTKIPEGEERKVDVMRTKMRDRKLPKLLAATLAVVMVLMYAIPTSIASAAPSHTDSYDEVRTGGGQMVYYSHPDGPWHKKFQDATFADDGTVALTVTDQWYTSDKANNGKMMKLSGTEAFGFCVNATLGSDADQYNVRHRYLATEPVDTSYVAGEATPNPNTGKQNTKAPDNPTMLDAAVWFNTAASAVGNFNDTRPFAWGQDLYDHMAKALYYGYPVNALESDADEETLLLTTQAVVYYLSMFGDDSGYDSSVKTIASLSSYVGTDLYKEIKSKALDSSVTYPDDVNLYVYYSNGSNGSGSNSKSQNMIGISVGTQESSKEAISTQVKNNIISPAKDQTIKDTISYEGLEAGEKYTLSGALKNGSDESDIASTSEPVTFTAAEGGKGTEDVTFKFDASALKDGDKVVVYEYLYKGESAGSSTDDAVAKHEDLSDTNQTVTVKDGEITVTKTAGVKQAAVGDEITYTITIKNGRSVDATGYEATDKMESGLTYVSDSQNGTNDGATTTWKNLTIPANGELVITFVAKVAKDASGKVVNNVSIVEPDNPENPKGTSNDDADVTVLGAEDGTDNNDDTGSDDADSEEDDDDTAGTTTAKNDGSSSGKTIAKRTTKTGDDMPLGLIAILMGVAAAGVAVATKRRKA